MMKHEHRSVLLVGIILVGGVVLGLIVGAVSGVLLAPRSGEATRERLRKKAHELGEAIMDTSHDILNAGKHHVDSALHHGHEVVEHVRQSANNELTKVKEKIA
jgi:gas vesicle protein